jgi:hypothetical protein
MIRFMAITNMVLGWGNLLFYAYGSHEPASLAIGIACLFTATWLFQDER